eukprot:g5367.t1
MTRHWLHGATLLLFTIPPVAWAWWDNGHMLTAEIARQQLTKSQVAVINGLLEDPGNMKTNIEVSDSLFLICSFTRG